MNRLIKSSAIAVVSLGLAAALAGPVLAKPGPANATDPLSQLLGTSDTGGALLSQGQSPLMSVATPFNQMTEGKDPLDGTLRTFDKAAQSLDGTAQILPQNDLRNGLPVSDVAGMAGVQTLPGTPITQATTAPFTFSLLDGRQVVGVREDEEPVPGMFSAVSGRAGRAAHAPQLQGVTANTAGQAYDRLATTTGQLGGVTHTLANAARAVSAENTLGGSLEATRSAMPEVLSTELAPALGTPESRRSMRAFDEIAPLVEGTPALRGALGKAADPTAALTSLTGTR
ncbi:hypothetical protein [Nonomuraea sediminis]|uniref:hypothetical protein n=1 Tax=Nonomuraea sediminis TaxID=2835864 RepID=UPI001BDD602D|nr:hypothetical protein [Nonomuraea sediminis]